MKKPCFISNLAYAVRRYVGWCPETPETKGFLKSVRMALFYVQILKVRLVQLGMVIGISMQTVIRVLGSTHIVPAFLVLYEKAVVPYPLPPIEVLLNSFTSLLVVMVLVGFCFVSNAVAGYVVGKFSRKLRHGMVIGMASSILGFLASLIISSFYVSPSCTTFERIFTLHGVLGFSVSGNLDLPSGSIVDIAVGWIGYSLTLLACGGGGGAIGQLLSLQLGSKHMISEQLNATPSTHEQDKAGRPRGIIIISVLSIIGGLTFTGLAIGATVALLSGRTYYQGPKEGIGMMVTIGTSMIVVVLVGGLFFLLVGRGLWKGAMWAWTIEVILVILGLIYGITAISGLSSLICALILYYLFKPSTKAWFNRTIAAKRLTDTENCEESVEIRPQHRD